jgi:hypothetical protein
MNLFNQIQNNLPTMTSTEAARQHKMLNQSLSGLRGIAQSMPHGSEARDEAFATLTAATKLMNACATRAMNAHDEETKAALASM